MSELTKNYFLTVVIDCVDSNPNGDPNADGMPRIDSDTGCGLITDVCMKEKIRRTLERLFDERCYFNNSGRSLNSQDDEIAKSLGIDLEKLGKANSSSPEIRRKAVNDIVAKSCEVYTDNRMFGAVLTSLAGLDSVNNKITGPIQFSFGRSLSPITIQNHTISRGSISKDSDAELKESTFGTKYTTNGCYVFTVRINKYLAKKCGLSTEDVEEKFLVALQNMFEQNISAAIGMITIRKMIMFEIEGCNVQSGMLMDRVHITPNEDVDNPRQFKDYHYSLDTENLPVGVTCTELI